MSPKKENFENNLKKLEESVEKLERGEMSLEESLKEFEKGLEYYKKCNNMINDIEGKITIMKDNIEEGFNVGE